jgi:hypothetical protein
MLAAGETDGHIIEALAKPGRVACPYATAAG